MVVGQRTAKLPCRVEALGHPVAPASSNRLALAVQGGHHDLAEAKIVEQMASLPA